MKKSNLFFIVASIAIIFASCSSDDGGNGGGTSGIDSPSDITPSDFTGNIVGDVSLSGDDYVITGPVRVKNGGILRLAAGMNIDVSEIGTAAYISVEKGGQIFINGTSVNPVVISSSNGDPGDWGGLEIHGDAPISGSTSGTSFNSEVTSQPYGGSDVDDNSGSISYLILSGTGASVTGSVEWNGLTLFGVGNGTTINNVAVINGQDDAFEFFGGSVNASNLLALNNGDDMFDWTQGYTGTLTNLLGILETASTIVLSDDPRGIEADGNLDGDSPSHVDQSDATVSNITILAGRVLSDIFKIRRGSLATITGAHGELLAAAVPGDFIDCADGKGNAASGTAITATANTTNGLNENDNNNGGGNATITTSVNTTRTVLNSTFSWVETALGITLP